MSDRAKRNKKRNDAVNVNREISCTNETNQANALCDAKRKTDQFYLIKY